MIDWKFIIKKKWEHRPLRIPDPYEPAVNDFIGRLQGGSYIDVGANVGIYAIRYHTHFHKVYAIEPHPKTLALLKMNKLVRFAKNVTVLPWAASNRNGETTLFLDGTLGRSAGSADTIEPSFTYRPASSPEVVVHYPNGNSGMRKANVITKRLDDYRFEDMINLVKIDVEGAEFKVLEGAIDTIGRTRWLIVEVHDRERKTELQNLLHDRFRFKTRWLAPDHILGGHW